MVGTHFFKETICLSERLNILNKHARNQAEIFFFFFLTLISLFSLILHLIRFNCNNEHHFLNKWSRKEFEIRTKANIYSIL